MTDDIQPGFDALSLMVLIQQYEGAPGTDAEAEVSARLAYAIKSFSLLEERDWLRMSARIARACINYGKELGRIEGRAALLSEQARGSGLRPLDEGWQGKGGRRE